VFDDGVRQVQLDLSLITYPSVIARVYNDKAYVLGRWCDRQAVKEIYREELGLW